MSAGLMSSKTVVMVDHTHWMREGSGSTIEIEGGGGGGGSSSGGRGGSRSGGGALNYFPSFIPPVSKSLWTCAVESVLEYARVVWDIFSDDRLLRFGLCEGSQGLTWLNDWEGSAGSVLQQSMTFMSEAFANAGPPMLPSKRSQSAVAAVQLGIQSAIEGLAQPTPAQLAFMGGSGSKSNSLKALNRGRVICVTSCTVDSIGKTSPEDLEEFFVNSLNQHNRMVAPASDHLLPIVECEFFLISIHPKGKEHISRIVARPLHENPELPILKVEIVVAPCDKLHQKIADLLMAHHDLISTTVTGIPMKEEQNAQSSSNYDVPLWHPKLPTSSQDSMILRWSSPTAPKTLGAGIGAGGQVYHCISAVRITPVDVNSRPSTCLSGFVVSGRSVWLDTPKKEKALCHMLTPHGTEMWMHVIETARNVLEDPPSISEGIGGRVTDYRIPDFSEFINLNMLIPYPKNYQDHVPKLKPERDGNSFIRRRSSSLEDLKKPFEMAKYRLVRKSSYWPLTISGSSLFPLSVHIEPLLKMMTHDELTDLEVIECERNIWGLMTVETRTELPLGTTHHKKGQKREEQWKAVYNELETFIRANQQSANHAKILECFLESRRADYKTDPKTEDKTGRFKDSSNLDKAVSDMAKLGSSKTVITDSPMSPPPVSAKSVPEPSTSKKSLLTLWTMNTEKKDFRQLTNTKLYPHLSASNDESRKMDSSK